MKKSLACLLVLIIALSACSPATVPASTVAPAPLPSAELTAPPTTPIPYYPDYDLVQRLDGSTATIPLSEAILNARLGSSDGLRHTKTNNAYHRLIDGESDIILVTYPSEDELDYATEKGVELEVIPVVKDALVFLVNTANPAENLSQAEIQAIYTGETDKWSNGTPIRAFQRPVNSGSQTLFLKLAMDGITPFDAPTKFRPTEMGNLIEAVADYDNAESALGYSVFYYASDMYNNNRVKLIAVDGVAPTRGTIASGEYPYITYYYAVIRKDADADSPERELIQWLLSEEGQMCAQSAGYVPLTPIGGAFSRDGYGYFGSTAENTSQSSGTGGTEHRAPDNSANEDISVYGHIGVVSVSLPDEPELEQTINEWIKKAKGGVTLYNSNEIISLYAYKGDEYGLYGTIDTAVFDRSSGTQLRLSDIFLDGVNYIDYINANLLYESASQSPESLWDSSDYIERYGKQPFSGLPDDYPYFALVDNRLDFYFPNDNPFFDVSAMYYVPHILVTPDLSPYAPMYSITRSLEPVADSLNADFINVRTWYDNAEENDKRTNALLREHFEAAKPYMRGYDFGYELNDYGYDTTWGSVNAVFGERYLTFAITYNPWYDGSADTFYYSSVTIDLTSGKSVDPLKIKPLPENWWLDCDYACPENSTGLIENYIPPKNSKIEHVIYNANGSVTFDITEPNGRRVHIML